MLIALELHSAFLSMQCNSSYFLPNSSFLWYFVRFWDNKKKTSASCA